MCFSGAVGRCSVLYSQQRPPSMTLPRSPRHCPCCLILLSGMASQINYLYPSWVSLKTKLKMGLLVYNCVCFITEHMPGRVMLILWAPIRMESPTHQSHSVIGRHRHRLALALTISPHGFSAHFPHRELKDLATSPAPTPQCLWAVGVCVKPFLYQGG